MILAAAAASKFGVVCGISSHKVTRLGEEESVPKTQNCAKNRQKLRVDKITEKIANH
jgi:hypothetical protein